MNEQTESLNQAAPVSLGPNEFPAATARGELRPEAVVAPQGSGGSCSCGAAPDIGANRAAASYVYAIGRIEPRFPSLSAEKEFAQVTGRSDTTGKTDRQTFHTVLSKRENRYLVRQLCWVLTIQGLESYLLRPRDPLDTDLLVEAIRSAPSPNDVDVVIGVRGPVAPPEMCNGLMVPIVVFDQAYSFDRDTLVRSIPKPDKFSAEQFGPAAEELFNRIMLTTDNAGAADEHRALNYLAMRYHAIYAKAAEMFADDRSLTAVDVRHAPLNGARNLVDVIFSYTHRNTDFTEKFFVRVDVTDAFPFLANKMSAYYDR
jgi:hypothetical protein